MTQVLALSLSVLSLLAVSACRGESTSEGIRADDLRVENSSLPPDQRGPTADPPPPARPQSVRGNAAAAAETWNAAQIDWQPYEAGLARAKAQNKPVCLIFSATWCSHCRAYSHVFEDARVVARAKQLVMIHLDADADSTLASQYTRDGGYVPRTFFLAPDGTLDPDIHAARPKFVHFFDEHDPASLLGGMETALHKLVK